MYGKFLFLTAIWASLTKAITTISSPTTSAIPATFTYNATSFLLNNEPYIIIGGQMDPQRIPYPYWRDRLSKARAMGLNTIFSYIYWNNLEPSPGTWKFNDPQNDIAAYYKIAQEEGLHVVLRPGPYICGEHEWGGFPYWLSTIPNLTVRTYNEAYLHFSKIYLERLAEVLRPMQVTQGGPLLMVQVENEYGSYGSNHAYTNSLRDILRGLFEVPLYTNDGSEDWTLYDGSVPGVLTEIDGGPTYGFPARDEYITNSSQLGPLLDGEYYTIAPDNWGANVPHQTTVGFPDLVEGIVSDVEFVLNASNSISLYMFHGGTNFGLSNGAIWENYTKAFTTSYDYGAPLDESGRTTALYITLRNLIAKYVPTDSIPPPPSNLPLLSIPPIALTPMSPLFSSLGKPSLSSISPVTMERLSQAYGFILYQHNITTSMNGTLLPGDRARDRLITYINGVKIGVIDSTYTYPQNLSLSVKAGDKLQLLVENLGRVDYFSPPSFTYNALLDPYKGILGNVSIDGVVLEGWDVYSLPVDDIPFPSLSSTIMISKSVTNISTPIYYYGEFHINATSTNVNTTDPRTLDTFIAIPNGIKGVVWINGFMLGRYWVVGPQQSLYCPGTLLREGVVNEVVVLEVEPREGGGEMVMEGLSERVWGNGVDPDYP